MTRSVVQSRLQPTAMVVGAATQSDIGTADTVVFGTEIKDTNGDFASNTFTAPVTGTYLCTAHLLLGNVDVDHDYVQGAFVASNRAYNFATLDPGQFNGDLVYFALEGTVLVDMDASDTVFVRVERAGGAAQTDIIHSANHMNFQVALLS